MSRLIDWTRLMPRPWLKAIAHLQWKNPLFKQLYDWATDRFHHQNVVIQRGLGQGLRINVGDSNVGYALGTSEPAMQAALKELLQPGMTFYDIGAGIGFFSIIAAALAGGTVICFEPLPKNAKRIGYNAKLNHLTNIVVKTEAIAQEDGEVAFNVSEQPHLSKLALLGDVVHPIETITVPARCLDTAIAVDQLPPPGLIKIDVEGAEGEVLKGGTATFQKYRPLLLIELHNNSKTVNLLLDEIGYKICVLGSQTPVRRPGKHSQIFAYPKERSDLSASATRLMLYVP
jgi:FkbM family methyltransferase